MPQSNPVRRTIARMLVVTLAAMNLLAPFSAVYATYVPDKDTMYDLCVAVAPEPDPDSLLFTIFDPCTTDPYGTICAAEPTLDMCDPILNILDLNDLLSSYWYDYLMLQSVEDRSASVQYLIPSFIPTLMTEVATKVGTTSTFVVGLEDDDAIDYLVLNMSDAQLDTLIGELVEEKGATLSSFLTGLGLDARERIVADLPTASLTALLDVLTTTQITNFMFGTLALDSLPCTLQEVVVTALSQERLDQLLEDLAAAGTTAADSFFTKVCTTAAETIVEEASEDSFNAVAVVLSVAVVGALLYAFSTTGTAVTLATKLTKAGVSATSGVIRPHGGRAITTVPCTCMPGTFLITIGALTNPTIIGPRMWIATVTQQYAVGNIWPPAWQLGIGTGMLGCFQYAGTTCAPSGGGPIMLKNGTSAS